MFSTIIEVKTMSKDYDSEFEKTVFDDLPVKHKDFDDFVNLYGGYAQLLRNWIFDAFKNGQTPYEVAREIQKSPQAQEQIELIIDLYKK
ncbi:hypothetical protein [Aquimarina algiphila]|uniref:Uncharacterized protein n=1 Tax=Aquimarina algiphila TaxID=2047982 RepID=A0A554VEH7_9FLAO|nr:hypothetical protein [Aquimarina algiphila]TSE05425.1 hypothetical protein FOF46_22950 [Aquimarina algiphila]